MSLPPITALTPSNSAAIAANNYGQMWTTQIVINTPSPVADGTAVVKQRNYDGVSALDPNPANGYAFTSDVWTDSGKYAMYARVMESLVVLINLLNPIYVLRGQIATATATLTKQQSQLNNANGQVALWNTQPDSSPVKAASIATINATIASVTAAIAVTTDDIAAFNASLTTAESLLV